jgi:glyoxylase-like metal-dependent hydrolase (beta-lactamase superfamily II)
LQPVSDGVLHLDPAGLFHAAPPETWQPRVQPELDANGKLPVALTCLLVQAGDRRILIDTGFGPRPADPAVGHLPAALGDLGVTPESIDQVVISHAHGDHIGGATRGIGPEAQPSYGQARYWLGQADWDHFSQPDVLAARAGLSEKLLPLEAAGQLDLAADEHEIAPGVRLLPLPGHTPGHMGVVFTSGQEMAIYVGDLIHHPLQIEHPDWCPIFDALPPISRETRRQLLERAHRDGALVLSYHLPFPGIGHVNGAWRPAGATQ